MKSSTARATGLSSRSCLRCQRRWISPYRRLANGSQAENDNAIEGKLQEGLGKGDKAPRINHQKKHIDTAAGELPMSPLFDRDWLAKRQKIVKPPAGQASGRFRKKVYNNPFAQALAQPIRRCNKTLTELPRFFMQDLEIVQHPTTGNPWWTPGPLSFTGLNLRMDTRVEKKRREKEAIEAANKQSSSREQTLDNEVKSENAPAHDNELASHAEPHETIESASVEQAPHRSEYSYGRVNRAPVAAFVLSNEKTLRSLNPSYPIIDDRIAFVKGQVRYSLETPDALLKTLRQYAVDALVARSVFGGENPQRWVEPCANWEAIKDVRVRGCVLWLPKSDEEHRAHKPYSTFDVDAVFGAKLAVYNLRWLLGEGELARLKSKAEVFAKNEILVLTAMPEKFMMQLHLLLWRLEGYLATSSLRSKEQEAPTKLT